jgi:glutathione S-transferase
MIILYGAPSSVFVRKPRILLQEKQIEFVVDPINLYEYVNDEFIQASPLKKIPTLRDGGFTLADSSAICAYLDKKYPHPSFYPNNPEDYGKALWYEEYADTVLFQAIAPCYYQTVLVPLYHHRAPDNEAINTAIRIQLPKVASYLENELINKQFLVGNQFTIADVAIVSIFMNMYLSGFQLDQKSWPNLSTYLTHHFERESFNSCIKDVEGELLKIRSVIAV